MYLEMELRQRELKGVAVFLGVLPGLPTPAALGLLGLLAVLLVPVQLLGVDCGVQHFRVPFWPRKLPLPRRESLAQASQEEGLAASMARTRAVEMIRTAIAEMVSTVAADLRKDLHRTQELSCWFRILRKHLQVVESTLAGMASTAHAFRFAQGTLAHTLESSLLLVS